MQLEEFLDKRLTKEQLELLNANSKLEKIEESKEENKCRLIITLPNELVDVINGKKILKDNIVKFIMELKKELELEGDIASIATISYI